MLKRDKKATPTTKYPDTLSGARQYLADAGLRMTGKERGQCDPQVEGVWQVTLSDYATAVVYLAGYRDPWGRRREVNDFEEVWN